MGDAKLRASLFLINAINTGMIPRTLLPLTPLKTTRCLRPLCFEAASGLGVCHRFTYWSRWSKRTPQKYIYTNARWSRIAITISAVLCSGAGGRHVGLTSPVQSTLSGVTRMSSNCCICSPPPSHEATEHVLRNRQPERRDRKAGGIQQRHQPARDVFPYDLHSTDTGSVGPSQLRGVQLGTFSAHF